MQLNFWDKKITIIFSLLLFLLVPGTLSGARVDELRDQISEKNNEITRLEEEIREYEKRLENTKEERGTLENAIQELDIARRKLQADIQLTEKRIANTNLNIERLSIDIDEKQDEIQQGKKVIGETIRELREQEGNSFIEILFLYESLSSFWSRVDNLQVLQKDITVALEKLRKIKEGLEVTQTEAEVFRDDLVVLDTRLSGQKRAADVARDEKDTLLTETKSKESEYERILAEKIERKEIFEQELIAAEEALRIALDPSQIPNARTGILSWPLENVVLTQYFGNTPFATQNPSIYSGRGHNGIDLGAPVGTPIYAAREGVIVGAGNTDSVCPNASYGRWMLIEHDNGLSTLYAHLSRIDKGEGTRVSRNDIIGFVGNTGYSTGPHLHFTVFASDGVKIDTLVSRVCSGAQYTIPLLSKQGGYLNPLSYLPEL